MLWWRKIDAIKNADDIYDALEDLYLSEIEREEKLLQDIQSENGLKVRVGAKREDGMRTKPTIQENVI